MKYSGGVVMFATACGFAWGVMAALMVGVVFL